MSSLKILGCRLDMLDGREATSTILALARDGRGAQVVTLGTEMVVHAQNDPGFRAIVNDSTLSLCDTVGLLAVARRRGAALRERVTGVELVERLAAGAAAQGLPVYFLGGAEGVADAAAAALQSRFPGLRVVGTRSGYFSEAESPAVAAAVAASGARLLFAGMGSPRQEYWLAAHLAATGCGVGLGVGGSFDVIAGRIDRAPPLARRLGLEWLYRLVKEPRRWRRQLALPRFVWLILLDELRLRSPRNDAVGS
ncbi:MAG: WecB/TagA/CpsF family glycosyltransferase [Candidatus Eremiobacteraeota bacterium]|nr:WecB/TagA/CpsF family glycosyltransferase [Candidatus Eremiobacteraeota bacterium]